MLIRENIIVNIIILERLLGVFKPTKDSGDDRRLKSVPATVAELVEKEIKKTSEDQQRTATDAIVS